MSWPATQQLLKNGLQQKRGVSSSTRPPREPAQPLPSLFRIAGIRLSRKDILVVATGLAAAVWSYDFLFESSRDSGMRHAAAAAGAQLGSRK